MAAAARSAARLPSALLLLGLLALGGLASGCQQVSAYTRSRTLDLLDAVPMSVGWGWGVTASIKATPCFQFGLGLSPLVDQRFGFEDRRLWGYWHEFEADFPWSIWLTDISSVPPRPPDADVGRLFGDGPPIFYRWQLDRDAPLGEGHHRGRYEPQPRQWGRNPPYGREEGGGFIVPAFRRKLDWHDLHLEQGDNETMHALSAPDRATLWQVSRDGPDEPQAWDLFEADVFAGIVGLRLGFRPVEVADFFLGIIGIDFMNDDVFTTMHDLPSEEKLGEMQAPAAAP